MPITSQDLDLSMALSSYAVARYGVLYGDSPRHDLTLAIEAVHAAERAIPALFSERPAVLGTGTVSVVIRPALSELVEAGLLPDLIESIMDDGAVNAYASL